MTSAPSHENRTALDHLSLDVPRDGRTVVLGHNGAGKSTLLEVVATLRTPTGGTVTVEGYDVVRLPREVSRLIGLTLQSGALDTPVEALTVGVGGAQVVGRVFFPTWTWAAMILVLVPLVGYLATSLIVAVSGRCSTMQGAQGAAMLIVFPILAQVVSQATGLMLFDVTLVLVAAVVDAVTFWLVVAKFDRERIVTRL